MPKVTTEYRQNARNDIIAEGTVQFSRNGYRGTKMDDIAGTLGISKGKLYLYFPSKEDLFLAVCESFYGAVYADDPVYHRDAPDLEGYLGGIYDREAALLDRYYPILADALSESKNNPRLRDILWNERATAEGMSMRFLRDVQGDGRLLAGARDLGGLSAGVAALYDGLALGRLIGRGPKASRGAFVATMAAILRGGGS